MHHTRAHPILMPCAAVAALAAAPCAMAQGSACEPLRINIEEKIRRNGGTNFTVSIVDAKAGVPGRVVGSCEGGARKLVYTSGTPAPAGATEGAAAAATARKAPARGEMIIECFDGRRYRDGPCKR
jgi:Protein of unknown function (DUF1161)